MATRYQESEDHVPDNADLLGTYDTTGAGAHSDPLEMFTNVYAAAAAQDLAVAEAALDDDNEDVPKSLVVVAEQQPWEEGDPVEDAKTKVADAKAAAEEKADAPYGSTEWFEQNTGEMSQEDIDAIAFLEASAGGPNEGFSNTDLTGTLDTTGTSGSGVPDAFTIAAVVPPPEEGAVETEDDALGEADAAPEAATAEANGEYENGYDEWTKDELIEEARGRGLAVSGTKDELIQRLIDNDNES